jgi:hypothetical protein
MAACGRGKQPEINHNQTKENFSLLKQHRRIGILLVYYTFKNKHSPNTVHPLQNSCEKIYCKHVKVSPLQSAAANTDNQDLPPPWQPQTRFANHHKPLAVVAGQKRVGHQLPTPPNKSPALSRHPCFNRGCYLQIILMKSLVYKDLLVV